MNHVFGLNQGFDVYYDGADKLNPVGFGSFQNIMPLALEWLNENKGSKFFLFLHSYDVHEPFYSAGKYISIFNSGNKCTIEKFSFDHSVLSRIIGNHIYISDQKRILKLSKADKARIIACYDSCIRYADEYVGLFLRNLESAGLKDNTLIIILSDHGEELFDHGFVLRHGGFYDEIVHVPLIINCPVFKENKRVKQQVQLIDVVPTILDFLNINIAGNLQGKSLIPLIKNSNSGVVEHDIYAYTGERVIRSRKWKYKERYALFDLENDPKELRNLIFQKPSVALELDDRLREWQQENRQLSEELESADEITIETGNKEKLKKMGYWQ